MDLLPLTPDPQTSLPFPLYVRLLRDTPSSSWSRDPFLQDVRTSDVPVGVAVRRPLVTATPDPRRDLLFWGPDILGLTKYRI